MFVDRLNFIAAPQYTYWQNIDHLFPPTHPSNPHLTSSNSINHQHQVHPNLAQHQIHSNLIQHQARSSLTSILPIAIMKAFALVAPFMLLCIAVQASSSSQSPSSAQKASAGQHALRKGSASKHHEERPMIESLGSFTEEQHSVGTRSDGSETSLEYLAMRKQVRSAKAFRPNSPASQSNERSIDSKMKTRSKQKVTSNLQDQHKKSDQESSSKAQDDESNVEAVEGEEEDPEDLVFERYDVDPATHPLP